MFSLFFCAPIESGYLTPVLKSGLGRWICSMWRPVDIAGGLFDILHGLKVLNIAL